MSSCGSSKFRNSTDIERLYEHLEILFAELSTWCRGMTLKEFHAWFRKSPGRAASGTYSGRLPGRTADQEMASA